jgi:hypothetical protein
MATLKTYSHYSVVIGGVTYSAGSLTTPSASITVTTSFVQSFSVATANTQKIFDVADDLADFDYMYVVSDQTIELEVVADDGANVVVSVLPLFAGVPQIFGSDASRDSDHTEDWGVDGAAVTIDKLTINNASGSTALITVAAFT